MRRLLCFPDSVWLEKPDRICKLHPSPDLRRDVLDKGDVVVVQPVSQVKGVDREDVGVVFLRDHVGPGDVEDTVSGRPRFIGKDAVLIGHRDEFRRHTRTGIFFFDLPRHLHAEQT